MSGGIEDASKYEEQQKELTHNEKVKLMRDILCRNDAPADGLHPLQKVFDEVINQVSKGKGEERHGNGKYFLEQPWKDLCDTYGVGFAFGQAAKKLSESQGMTGEARKRELLGAVAYLAIGVLYEDMKK